MIGIAGNKENISKGRYTSMVSISDDIDSQLSLGIGGIIDSRHAGIAIYPDWSG